MWKVLIFVDYMLASLAPRQEAMKEPVYFVLHECIFYVSCWLSGWFACQIGKALPAMIKMSYNMFYKSLQRVPLWLRLKNRGISKSSCVTLLRSCKSIDCTQYSQAYIDNLDLYCMAYSGAGISLQCLPTFLPPNC